MQFSAINYNLLSDGEEQTANYLVTGAWSVDAIRETKKYCNVNEVASNIANKYETLAPSDEWNIA